jgi:hypothetical protein
MLGYTKIYLKDEEFMKKISLIAACLLAYSLACFAQITPRDPANDTKPVLPPSTMVSVEAKYEGGLYGYSTREKGMLKFDDDNERLVFFGKDKKEKFSIPYKSMLLVFPNSQSAQSVTGTAVSMIPVPGAGLASLLIRKKYRFMVIQFEDSDVDVRGITNFKLENKEILAEAIRSLGERAKMKSRGDAYYKEDTRKKSEMVVVTKPF